jgi:hypothetical protein
MVARVLARWVAGLAAMAAFGSGCVGSESSSPSGGADSGANSGANPFVGTYTATYSGVFTVTAPQAQPQATTTETGTFVIAAPTNDTLEVTATFTGPNGVSGTCTDTAARSGNTAASDPATQACPYSVTGGTQTNESSNSYSVSGTTVTDSVTGTFTGTNASGSYSGTFSGTWTLVRQ